LLGKMPRESVDLVVTSPPYDDLRTYGGHSGGQVVGVMGADRAWRLVSARVGRMMSLRRCGG
jgi:DNA modification methylase